MRSHAVLDTPIGPLTAVADDGALSGLYMDGQRHRPEQETFGPPGDGGATPFGAVAEQLAAYFAGELTEFDLPLAMRGTPFQQRVWAALREIPYGETVSYGRLAEEIGSPGASRAVGLANGRNPISVIVPCHRVVGASGGLTGYGGGLERKRHLLDFERRVRGTSASPAAALF
ncbi:methylated-DNA--[protein]-cysteine S-methyltransferase [Actinomadura viridis]|uniref:Methylated-DNA--protein-cysteine methyltransferase n=1 Tax=Actinomadura viridis TaxID=58110 RepID=A0A931DR97_9ACTN|nr:methylated-DNA--[protein]-cysteine S-methyltransferase [Actinomadura viridis]MBG6092341.1 methylated-DNA-[protein]-cysteine S-methyltransferase [Actinomadura viridis]